MLVIFVQPILDAARKRLAVLSQEAPLTDAAAILTNCDTPLVVVCDEQSVAVGVISSSDLVKVFATAKSDAMGMNAGAIMSHPVISCQVEEPLQQVPAAALIQPILSDDVVSVLAEIALGPPVSGTIEVGGPERFQLDRFITRALSLKNDKRRVVADPHARYYGTKLNEKSLIPGNGARVGQTRLDAWLSSANTSRYSQHNDKRSAP